MSHDLGKEWEVGHDQTNIFGQDRTFEEHDGLDIIWVVLNFKF
jgi:hypothetical protein